jgi:DNA polymerase-3 subunit epsilon
LHGALLDSEILAEVYLELIGGRQPDLVMGGQTGYKAKNVGGAEWRAQPRATKLAPKIKAAEADAHAAFIRLLGDNALWNKS